MFKSLSDLVAYTKYCQSLSRSDYSLYLQTMNHSIPDEDSLQVSNFDDELQYPLSKCSDSDSGNEYEKLKFLAERFQALGLWD